MLSTLTTRTDSSMATTLTQGVTARRESSAVRPLPVSSHQTRLLVGTQPFARLGRWTSSIHVAHDGTIGHLARWLALHRSTSIAADLWERCRAANPECFRTFRVVAMDFPSFFLPAGEVVFEAIENPTQIPDRPPQGVMLRHLEALDAFSGATFYFLRPVFVVDPCYRLATADELRREAHFDEFDALRIARRFGCAFRMQQWASGKARDVKLVAMRTATRLLESLTWELSPALPFGAPLDSITRRRLRRQYTERLARTQTLGLAEESRRLSRAIEDLRRRVTIDPILCFEIPRRAGELWFEAHWYTGCDGRMYVHY